jgi:hypothetical protein
MPRRSILLVFVSTVLTGLLLAFLASRTPAPRGPDAAPERFSAGRAMDDVRAIARAPHPTGSAENRRVRDYLIARLGGMGLEVRTSDGEGVIQESFHERYGRSRPVSNIVAVLPGRERRLQAVTLMSHYDARDLSPGAADDAAGVAASLEIARAIQAAGPARRDLVLLITDGEELGLAGAFNFFAHDSPERRGAPPDPLARRIGAVLNMEARGGGGRAFMFETSPNNGNWVRLYAREAQRPSSTSLAVYVYSIMRNATDFSVSAYGAKIPGLNWAFIGRPAQYHQPSSTPENLDQGSVQHMGEQVLPITRALLAAERLPGPAPDAVYSDVLGAFVVIYPPWAGWLVLAAALVLAAVAWRRPPPWKDALLGFGGAIGVAVLAGVLLRLTLIVAGRGGREALLENFGLYEVSLVLACTLATVVVCALLARWRGRSVSGLWFGFVLLGLLLTLALQIYEPTVAHTLGWPTLLACAAAAVAARRPESPQALVAIASASALTLGQVGEWGHAITLGVGDFLPEVLALFTVLAALPLAPLLLMALRQRGGAEGAGSGIGRPAL